MSEPSATIEMKAAPGARYLSVARVCDKLSRKKSWLYDRIKNDPSFPRPLRLGAWPVFLESEIDAYVLSRQPVAPRDAAQQAQA